MMQFVKILTCRLKGHYWSGGQLAKKFNSQTMNAHPAYIVHARCVRCGEYRKIESIPRPSGLPVVSSD